jgi:hypothetical protein
MPEGNENYASDALRALSSMKGTSPEISDIAEKEAPVAQESVEQAETVATEQRTEESAESQVEAPSSDDSADTSSSDRSEGSDEAPVEKNEEKTSEDNKSEDDLYIESQIFGGKKSIENKNKKEEKEGEPNEVAFESVDQVQSYLKENLDIDDIKSLGSVIEDWKKKEVLLSETTERVANADKLFQSMHPDLYQAILKDIDGQDWKSGLLNAGLDFNKSAEDFSDEEILENFYPNEVSEDDWEEYHDEDGDPRTKRTINLLLKESKEKFSKTKLSREEEAKGLVENQSVMRRKIEESIDKSASTVYSSIDGVDETYVKSVVKRLKTEGVGSLFYNEDGTVKEDSVLKFIMAEDGLDLIKQQNKIIERQMETKVNQDILSRGANVPKVQTGKNHQAQTEISEGAQKTINALKKLNKTQTY